MSRRMTRRAAKEVTIDPEAWARNLRAQPDARDKDATTRRMNNYLAFWAICEQGACKRAKRCAGDAQACFDFIFPQLPERMKAQFRAELKAAHAGGTPEEVKRRIREELARFDAMTAQKERASNEHRSVPLPHSPSKTGVNALLWERAAPNLHHAGLGEGSAPKRSGNVRFRG